MFGWWKRRRRRRLRQDPFPDSWLAILQRNVEHYARIPAAAQRELRARTQVLVAEKNWEGCNGLLLNDEIRVTIAAQISLLVLGLADQYFDAVLSILIYPDEYVAPDVKLNLGGVVLEGESSRQGEAWYRGPVILSWPDALAGGRRHDQHNLVLHEFAHQLDMENGNHIDGMPPLRDRALVQRWQRIMPREFARLTLDCQTVRGSVLDCYGTTNIGEFFAVATESFFQQPATLAAEHAPLYELLRDYFGQDPIAWPPA